MKRKSKQLPRRRRNTLFEKFRFDFDIKNEIMLEMNPNFKEKEKAVRKKSLKLQNTTKFINGKIFDLNNKSELKSDKKTEKEKECIKACEDYFAKEEKEECIII